MSDQRVTFTVPEVARLLGVSRGSAYQAARAGEIPGVIRLGRRLLVSRHALEQLLGVDDLPADNGNGGGENQEEGTGPGATPMSATRRGDVNLALEP